VAAAAALATALASPTPASAGAGRFQVPAGTTQLLVISSPTRQPADHLATFRAYERATARSAWRIDASRPANARCSDRSTICSIS